ncbi:MAG: translesion error-prone DNA polymerase V subunit UmuC [Desulfuromonadales bacterium]|jgi:DNA polymerase V
MTRTFALVDVNNFYVSCERLFRPDLRDTPVVVLSNNDGCIVARSQEVKDLGIKMGTPLFQVMHQIKRHAIQVFSSNYTLYGDISARVMQTLEECCPRVEVYSIDEAFLDLSGMADVSEQGRLIRSTVMQNVGVPVCIGIAPTKTLAKLASHAAKTYPATHGVVDLTDSDRQKRLMAITPVGDVWGIGRKLTKRLEEQGLKTALDLSKLPPKRARQTYSVVLERTVRELCGENCLELDDVVSKRQQILCSRSFGEKLTHYEDVKQAICEFAARAAAKLRGEDQLAGLVSVFLRTSPYESSRPQYANAATGALAVPSSDTRKILARVTSLYEAIWREGYRYAKAGVILADFCTPHDVQLDLFGAEKRPELGNSLMQAVDAVNRKSQGTLWFGGQRPQKDWYMRQANRSPAWTTRWDSLPRVNEL